MATTFTFPALKPRRQGCLLSAAASTSGTSVVASSWRRPWRCLRLQVQAQQHSAQPRHGIADAVDDDGDRLSPDAGSFQPSIWGDFFLHHSSSDSDPAGGISDDQQTWMLERAELLKEEVRGILSRSVTLSLHQRLDVVDTLERLCLDYLFQEEINIILDEVSTAKVSDDYDLQTVALWFYLLRKHAYQVSSDVFVRFRDAEGRFLAHTPMDLLNLYNAASLRTHGEIILDEATLFTRKCLEASLPNMKGLLARETERALEIPLPRRVSIYESKDQISRYENEASIDEAVIQLAKLNSNIIQLHYQQELEIITTWWNDLNMKLKLPFARDRIVECYWMTLGAYFEPWYSRGRIILTMVISFVIIFDDIYDSYATAQDSELFTTKDLPECMKFVLRKYIDAQPIENELAHTERYRMLYLRNFTLDLVRDFSAEVKMRENGYVPKTVEEHLQVSLRTGSCHLVACACLVGMGDIATKDSFDWVSSMPKMVQGLCIILRLLNDLQTYK